MKKNSEKFKIGQIMNGFKLLSITPLSDLQATAYELIHAKTGAKWLHLANNDSENVFAAGFKTIPQDSTGVAHILEHTVLTGSKKFPVRDPFFSMLKRSLNTFMNAFTANDWTVYPFATQSKKDYYNLMDVYNDAVFFPTISKLNFMQEGHRLEIDEETEELKRVGVVYGEMKGVESDPGHYLANAVNKALFRGNYRFNSGGDPAIIPTLTHKNLVAFHKRFYHPSNAYFYTYGNFPLSERLKFVNEKVMKKFKRINPKTDVVVEKKWNSPKEFISAYPVDKNEDIEKKYQAMWAVLTAPVEDSFQILTLGLLTEILLGNSASPLRKALIDSKLGRALTDIIGLEDSEYREAVFTCGLKDIKEKDVKKVENIILNTLNRLVEKGIDKNIIESAIHQLEFSQREVKDHGMPRGIALLLRSVESWHHGNNPIGPLQFDKNIKKLRQELNNGPYLENQIKKYFLDNNNRALITLKPDPEKIDKKNARLKKELRKTQSELSADKIKQIKKNAQALKTLQETKEDLSCLPTLGRKDIPRGINAVKESPAFNNSPITGYEQATNGILYLVANFKINGLPAALIPYVPIFCCALPKIGTKKRNYEDMARLINSKTGGVNLTANAFTLMNSAKQSLPLVGYKTKCLERNIKPMFEITEELLKEHDFSNITQLKNILEEIRSGFESGIQRRGHLNAMGLAARGLSQTASLAESWNGIHGYLTVKEILRDQGGNALKGLAIKLNRIGKYIFTQNNIHIALISDSSLLEKSKKSAENLRKALSDKKSAKTDQNKFKMHYVNEGWSVVGDASYAARVCKTDSYKHADAPVLAVISKLLGRIHLHAEIREKGGAYGGLSPYSSESGLFFMASYRDPHIVNTLNVFDTALDWLLKSGFSAEDVKEAILQVCSDIDTPEPPDDTAKAAFGRKLILLKDSDRELFKERLLKINKKQVLAVAEKLAKNMKKSSTAIISFENKLNEANKKLERPLELHKI